MYSRTLGDFGRRKSQIAATLAVSSTSMDTTVSTRRGSHHGCGSAPARARPTMYRRQVSGRGLVHTASPRPPTPASGLLGGTAADAVDRSE
ncbi:hypothetical protein [Streptomyces sp. SID13726]|uniref:hypothetical protein n=1 Tax=Streptomyces sp. SID13726 TaxID=2706058 RepID=UPI0019438A02|nr:hypothetical protein [Streptomyces sp. SID13726]